jgi:AraC family transcriptional regulator
MSGQRQKQVPGASRQGVDLVRLAGLQSAWSVPAVLWHAPAGFDTSETPDRPSSNTIAVRLAGSLVEKVTCGRGALERLAPDGFSIHPAGSELRFLARSEIHYAHLHITDRFLNRVRRETKGVSAAEHLLFRSDRVMFRDDEIRSAIEEYVRRAFDDDDPPLRLEMDSRATLIVLSLLKRHGLGTPDRRTELRVGALADWQVRKVCDYLSEDLKRNFALSELADLVGLSQEHFCRAFGRSMGSSPYRWLLERRMARARELLSDRNQSLTAIAQEVGYAGQSAFGVAFRKVTGRTPSQYRRAI